LPFTLIIPFWNERKAAVFWFVPSVTAGVGFISRILVSELRSSGLPVVLYVIISAAPYGLDDASMILPPDRARSLLVTTLPETMLLLRDTGAFLTTRSPVTVIPGEIVTVLPSPTSIAQAPLFDVVMLLCIDMLPPSTLR